MKKKQAEKFAWEDGDLQIIDKSPPDHTKMSEAEKAFFLKQQQAKK